MERAEGASPAQHQRRPAKCVARFPQEDELVRQRQLRPLIRSQELQVVLHLLYVLPDRQRNRGVCFMQLPAKIPALSNGGMSMGDLESHVYGELLCMPAANSAPRCHSLSATDGRSGCITALRRCAKVVWTVEPAISCRIDWGSNPLAAITNHVCFLAT